MQEERTVRQSDKDKLDEILRQYLDAKLTPDKIIDQIEMWGKIFRACNRDHEDPSDASIKKYIGDHYKEIANSHNSHRGKP